MAKRQRITEGAILEIGIDDKYYYSHPLPSKYGGDGKSSTRHMNVDLLKKGKKQRDVLDKDGHKNLEE